MVPANVSETGKRGRIRRTFRTKSEAEQHERELKSAWNRGDALHLRNWKASLNTRDTEKPMSFWLDKWAKPLPDKTTYHIKLLKRLFGTLLPSQLQKKHIDRLVSKELESGSSKSTIQSRLVALRGAMNEAVQCDAIKPQQNPFMGYKVRLPKGDARRHVYLSKEEESRLLEALGKYAGYARFAILTGMRQGEQLSLTWENIDWEKRLAHLPKTKNGKQRFVPLAKDAVEVLKMQQGKHDSLVFPSATGRFFETNNFRKRVWRPAFERAGLSHARWHDLRHTCASRMIQAGVPLFTVGQVLGHSSQAVTMRYAHLAPGNLMDAVELIE